jgi:hypothetical protein
MLLHANARTSGRRMWGICSAPRHGAMHANTLATSQSDGHGHSSTPCPLIWAWDGRSCHGLDGKLGRLLLPAHLISDLGPPQ